MNLKSVHSKLTKWFKNHICQGCLIFLSQYDYRVLKYLLTMLVHLKQREVLCKALMRVQDMVWAAVYQRKHNGNISIRFIDN